MLRTQFWGLDASNRCFRKKGIFRKQARTFDEVTAICARQVDAITYDENLLDFEMIDGSLITIGETDCGLQELVTALRWFGVDGDWYSQLERGGPGTDLCLYRKNSKI